MGASSGGGVRSCLLPVARHQPEGFSNVVDLAEHASTRRFSDSAGQLLEEGGLLTTMFR